MFITKLNKLFENYGTIAFVIMLLIIIGPFVLVVGPTSLMDAFYTDNSIQTVSIDGEVYTENDLMPYIKMVSYQRMITGTTTNDEEFILPAAVECKLLLDYAKKMKIPQPTNEEIRDSIRSQIIFQDPQTGKFSQQYYDYYKYAFLARLQITPRQYDELIGKTLILRKLSQSIHDEVASSLTEEELSKAYQEQNSILEVYFKKYTTEDFKEIAQKQFELKYPTTEDQNKFYQEFYQNNVEPLRSIINAQLVSPTNDPAFQSKENEAIYAAAEAYGEQVMADKEISDLQKQVRIQEMSEKLGTYAVPFFRNEQKKINYIHFAPTKEVTVTEEEKNEIYEKGKETFFKNVEKTKAMQQITEMLTRQRGMENAKLLATAFCDELLNHFNTTSNIETSFTQTAQKFVKEIKHSDFFDHIAVTGNIEDYTFRSEVYRTISKDMPVSQPIQGNDGYYVAVWQDGKSAYLPTFDVNDAELIESIRNINLTKEASKLAQGKGQEDFKKIEKCPLENIDAIAKELDMTAFSCSRKNPDMKITPYQFLNSLELTQGASVSTITEDGFSMAYLKNITAADSEAYQKDKATFKTKYTEEKATETFQQLIIKLHQDLDVQFLNTK